MPAWTARADGRRLLLLAIRGFDSGDGFRHGCEHELRVPGAGTGEDLEHGGLKVPALFLGVPGPQAGLAMMSRMVVTEGNRCPSIV